MGTIGKACIVPEILGEAQFSYHLFRVRPDQSKCLSAFLSATINHSGTFLEQLTKFSHGAIMAGLKTSDLKEVKFLIPPIDLQHEYIAMVNKLENYLKLLQGSYQEENNLFDSLLQRAFRGEL